MARYRRIELTREQSVASMAASLAIGAGAAAVTFYLTRLLLSRDELASPDRAGHEGAALGPDSASPEALPASAGAEAPVD